MKFKIDHDLHIHSKISSCSDNPLQTNERILQYAKDNNFKTICLTDHFWDSKVEGASPWYVPQNYEHIEKALPLPQGDGIRFLFGCETELSKDLTLAIDKTTFEKFDFVIIPTTHLHMLGLTIESEIRSPNVRAKIWANRLRAVFNMDLPFHKIGIAHLTCPLITPKAQGFTDEDYINTLNLISKEELFELFTKAAKLGVGIELNFDDVIFNKTAENAVFRIYKIAKECGCKFYLGSDAHHPERLEKVIPYFQKAIDVLELTEDDKFII